MVRASSAQSRQHLLQPVPIAPAHRQLGVIRENHQEIAVTQGAQLAHRVGVDNGGSVDANEAARVQALFQGT